MVFQSVLFTNRSGVSTGSDEWRMNGLILAQVWMDSKPVDFITTLHRTVHETDTPQNKKVVKSKGKRMAMTFLAPLVLQIIAIMWATLFTPIRL